MVTREQTQARLDLISAGMMKHTPEQGLSLIHI